MRSAASSVDSPVDVRLVAGPVSLELAEPYPPECGGECIFLGRTRLEHHPAHGELQSLHYEAYEPMAERVLEQIAREAVERYGCIAVRVRHATGEVPIGEASVLVQVLGGHRAEAFEACRLVIDELKARAPIWKREQWRGGETWASGSEVKR